MQLFYYQSFYESFEGSVIWEQVTGEEFGSKKLWGGVWTSKYEYQNINWIVKLEIKTNYIDEAAGLLDVQRHAQR